MASEAVVQTSVLDHACDKILEVPAKAPVEDISRVESKISSNGHRQSWQWALGQDARILLQRGQDFGLHQPVRNQEFENHLVDWQPNQKAVPRRLVGTFDTSGQWSASKYQET
jgi:hypothetical protein